MPGGGILMQGDLGEPVGRPIGVVLFAHGSGSSRLSPRNRHVAGVLQARGMSRGDLTIVPRATHLFEEPGALDQVARLAAHWFEQHFRQAAR